MQNIQTGSLRRFHKSLLPIFVFALSLSGALLARSIAVAQTKEDAAVRDVLMKYTAAVERGDLEAISTLWANDESVIVIENGHANYGWADYKDHHLGPELKEMKNVKYALSDLKVKVEGKTAWATFKYSIAADLKERHVEDGGLGTAVVQHSANGWRIVHWHTSSARRAAAPAKN